MRVVLVPSAYAPMVGGVEQLTARLAHALIAHGDEVEIWTSVPDSAGVHGSEQLDGVTIRRMPMPLPHGNPASLAKAIVPAARTLRAMRLASSHFRPDVLHVQCFSNNGAYATAFSALARVPLVVTLQGETFMDDNDIYGRSLQLRTWLRLGLRRARMVTGCSQYTLDDARRFGLDSSRSRVVFNGVDLDEGSVGANSPEERYVLALGRVVHNKGFDLLLKAFARVAPDVPDLTLVIAGDGRALPSLRSEVAALGLAHRVAFPGLADRAQVENLMRGAAMVVVPSRVEPFGIVVLEAWRAAKAVIATNRGGIPEFTTDGRDALLVDPTDTARLGEAIRVLASDPDRCRALGEAASARVRDFVWNDVAARYREAYAVATAE